MTIIAIDPGSTQSAVVVTDGERIYRATIACNEQVMDWLASPTDISRLLVIEQMLPRGMPMSVEAMETIFVSGMFAATYKEHGGRHERLPRLKIKQHICGSTAAKDANIRQALIDRFGGKNAIGTKKDPGPLYKIKGDMWAALAVAVTWLETKGRTNGTEHGN